MEHKLVDNTVKVIRDKNGEVRGITAQCSCGWVSAGHFSGMGASAAFQEHKECRTRE